MEDIPKVPVDYSFGLLLLTKKGKKKAKGQAFVAQWCFI